jgi:ketosteroid isomerase-like protein
MVCHRSGSIGSQTVIIAVSFVSFVVAARVHSLTALSALWRLENYMSPDEQEIRRLDRAWNEAYQRLDVAALGRILADDWTAIDGAGLIISKQQLLERVASSTDELARLEFDEFSLRLFGETAIVTGRLTVWDSHEEDRFRLRQRFTRVYVKRESLWQAVATQVTVMA